MSTADNELRCNNLKCRVFLAPEKQAVVTTCSPSCATTLFSASLTCPACSQPLPEPYVSQPTTRADMTSLNPTNDYRASILAGLSPSTILEVASRAMSFWTYQMSQESAFQALVLKNAQDRLATADKRLNNALEAELETARRRAQELANESREKSNELARLQAEYDKIKRKALFANPGQLEREDSVYQPSTRVARETTFGGPRSFIPAPHSGQPQPKFRAPSSARFAPPAPPVFPRSINGSSHSRSESGSGSGRMRLSHTFGSAGGY
ncbi:hypothetical protein IAT38_000379 [Cryptococcus sp. DSM 104549]